MTLVPIRRRRADRVAVLHDAVAGEGGPDEQDVLVQAAAVQQALAALGYTPVLLPVTLDLARLRQELTALNPGLVFNLVESIAGQGRLIHLVPSLLEAMGLPYTGAGAGPIWLTSQKPMSKRLMAAGDISTPAWAEGEQAKNPDFAGPYIVKSVWEHASIGIDAEAIADDRRRLAAMLRRRQRERGGEWFVERFIDGREFNLSLLSGKGGVELLPPAEMCFVDYPAGKPRIVDYAAKWHEGSFEYTHTVRRFDFGADDRAILAAVSRAALACWRLFELGGYARVDIRVDADGRPWVLEININPCLSADAGFMAAAARAGLGATAVVERIVGHPNGVAAGARRAARRSGRELNRPAAEAVGVGP
jgi:D-alanine-D-alanine ligase